RLTNKPFAATGSSTARPEDGILGPGPTRVNRPRSPRARAGCRGLGYPVPQEATRMPRFFTREQVERYHREGVLFPVPALSRPEVERFRVGYFDLEARLGGKPSAQQLSQTHLYFRWAYDLATHPAVLDAAEAILGPNILVWTVSIFPKHARDPGYISWHQDGTYWGLRSTQSTTAWVALTDSTVENGCMRVVKGSQARPILPHRSEEHTSELQSPDHLVCRLL